MNPLRSVFVALSRTPPALLLLIIVGLAALCAMVVTKSDIDKKAALDKTIAEMNDRANTKAKAVYVMKDVPEGSVIEADDLQEKDIELGRMPIDALPNSTAAVGRIAKFGVSAGQILSTRDLAPQGMQLGFDSHLKDGMRAVTFAVDANSGVAGFISPSSHVDIISMVGAGAETKVSPILSDVEIIAVGQIFDRQAKGQTAVPASSVTVAVSPDDTQKLIKAVAASKLYLSLRNDKDRSPVATVDVTSLFAQPKRNDLQAQADNVPLLTSNILPPPLPTAGGTTGAIESSSTAAVVPVPPPLHEIEIWSGSKKDVLSVPRN